MSPFAPSRSGMLLFLVLGTLAGAAALGMHSTARAQAGTAQNPMVCASVDVAGAKYPEALQTWGRARQAEGYTQFFSVTDSRILCAY